MKFETFKPGDNCQRFQTYEPVEGGCPSDACLLIFHYEGAL
jgi:hypothetical protein